MAQADDVIGTTRGAALVGCSGTWLTILADRGAVPCEWVAGRRTFRASDLLDYVARTRGARAQGAR